MSRPKAALPPLKGADWPTTQAFCAKLFPAEKTHERHRSEAKDFWMDGVMVLSKS
jgi:hypothetical protein